MLTLVCALATMQISSPREHLLFDDGWRFALGDGADATKDLGYGLGQPFAKGGSASFGHANWRNVDIPHDWMVEMPFVPDSQDFNIVAHGSKPIGRGFPATNVGWYQKHFTLAPADKSKRISLTFDGVFRDSVVFVNGHTVKKNESGYIGFNVDITDFVNWTGDNSIYVRCDTSHYEGWFYEGAGIYRHVWLNKTSPLHLVDDETFAKPVVKSGRATLFYRTAVANESSSAARLELQADVYGPNGQRVVTQSLPAMTVAANSIDNVGSKVEISNPVLWSLEHPNLYRIRLVVRSRGAVVDDKTVRFGVRTIRFDKDNGFFLNGKSVKIKGFCNHQDHAGVGSALPDRLQYFRLERLKAMGTNAYRCSHNPPTPELLDACDELGMLVMDENRLLDSSPEVLSQLTRLVKRDRNHPSIILWSIGNEEPEQGSDRGRRIGETMVRTVKALDDSRPTTYACNGGNLFFGVNQTVDVRGFNYILNGNSDVYHKEHPNTPLMGSEEASTLSTRGEYVEDKEKGYLTGYDIYRPSWGALAQQYMKHYMTRPYLAGAFIWTGFDYRGEPTPYNWPCISSHFGILDTCGFPKDLFYYYKSWWTNEPVMHLLPHWNWAGKEGQPIDVWAFTNADSVQLKLNGKPLGLRKVEKYGHAEWKVPYEPGRLEAIGFRNGKEYSRETIETTADPAAIRLTPDRSQIHADSRDVSVVTVSAHDANGRLVPIASNKISFEIDGPGKIIGVGNGDPSCHEPDRFIDTYLGSAVDNWQMRMIGATDMPKSIEAAQGENSHKVSVEGDRYTMRQPNTRAVYWSRFTTPTGKQTLQVGQIDDEGWIYVDGNLVQHTTDWAASYTIDLGEIGAGEHEIVVVVQNNGGQGGLARGVSVSGGVQRASWSRSLFNGLAQVIVQSTGGPGEIRLRAMSGDLKVGETIIRGN